MIGITKIGLKNVRFGGARWLTETIVFQNGKGLHQYKQILKYGIFAHPSKQYLYETVLKGTKNLVGHNFIKQPSYSLSTINADGCPKKSVSEKTKPACPPKEQPPPPPSQKNTFLKYLLLGLTVLGGAALVAKFSLSENTKNSTNIIVIRMKNRKRVPPNPEDIPKEIPYLLIGGGTASFSAFRAIKSIDPKAKVMVITNEYDMPYMRPPLSKELWFNVNNANTENFKFKQWNGVERSLFYEPDEFYTDPQNIEDKENGGVAIVRGYTVKKLDVCERQAILDDGTTITYGECLIATGSSPRYIDIFQSASDQIKKHVSIFKTTDDFENLRQKLPKMKSIAIIGGGFLGSELACALAKYGENSNLKTYQIFYENGNMGKVLPEYLSQWTTDRVTEEGVCVMPKTQVKSVELSGNGLKLNLIDGKSLLVDHVVLAVGSKPNTELAEESGLEVDEKHGGFVVNAELEARRHVYVAGDAACFYDTKLGRRRVEHHDHAVVSGRLAGENMAGSKKPYTHQSMFWSDLGPMVGYEAIGVIDSSLPTVGVFAKQKDTDTPAAAAAQNLSGTGEQKGDSTDNDVAIVNTVSEQSAGDTTIKKRRCVRPKKDGDESAEEDSEEDYGKGIIFYLRNDKVVGVLLWNIFNRIHIARKVIAENKKFDDLNEVAKLFEIHN